MGRQAFGLAPAWTVRAGLAVALLVGLVLTGCDTTTHRETPAASRPPSSQAPAPPISTAEAQRLANPTLADPIVAARGAEFLDVQYTSPTSAAVMLSRELGYDHAAVLATTDNWRTFVSVAVPQENTKMFAMSGGGAAVIPGGTPFGVHVPFLLRPDGHLEDLKVFHARQPVGPGARLVVADPFYDPHFWVIDPQRRIAFPAGRPCRCRYLQASTDVEGTVHVAINIKDEVQFARTVDLGTTWLRGRTEPVRQPADNGPHRGWFYGDFAAGPGRLLAMAADQRKYPDSETSRMLLTDLLISTNERSWRRIPTQGPEGIENTLAFTSKGRLVLTDDFGGRLWQLPPGGATLKPVAHSPRLHYLQTSGGVLYGQTRRRTIAVSTNGLTWTEVTPGLTP